MYGHTGFDKIKNEIIRGRVGVTSIKDKIREIKLRWFGHIKRSIDALVRRCKKIDRLQHRRGRSRPKKSLSKSLDTI